MRILILGINYYPERTSVSPFTTGLSEHLAAQGHTVRVVTAFPYYPEWRIWDEYRGRITQLETRRGVEVRRVRHFIPSRASSLLQRLAHDFSFTAAALVAGLAAGECDVVYCSCPPPALALAAFLISRIRNVPYSIKLTDLASDAAIATGILKDGTLLGWARAIERFAYRHASAVVCLCEAFRERLARDGLPATQMAVIPDWGDTEAVRPVRGDGSFRRAYGIGSEQFVVLHTGNMGKKQDLLNVVRAAQRTRSEPNLLWVIVGEGEERALIERAGKMLPNLRMLPLQPAAGLCQMYADADILLLNQKTAVKDAVIPSKLLTYMAAGKPVLCAANAESEAARLIREAQCGRTVAPENPEALAEGALALRANAPMRQTMGTNGRAYAISNFEKARVLSLYDDLFAGLLHRPDARAAIAAG
ncbi:MAG: WcaI family glycosyltransferase [Terriglobales bacterium]|jgi:colanic acid biosynthesis glycosyl transferase WcaI